MAGDQFLPFPIGLISVVATNEDVEKFRADLI